MPASQTLAGIGRKLTFVFGAVVLLLGGLALASQFKGGHTAPAQLEVPMQTSHGVAP